MDSYLISPPVSTHEMEVFELTEIWDSESFTAALHAAEHFPLLNVCPDQLCWGLWEVQLLCCHSLLQVFASSGVSSLWSLSLCSCTACNFACAILCHESCPTLDFFILLMYQVILHKMQTSPAAWSHLWQPGVTSHLTGSDWWVTCQPDSDHGVCVYVSVDLCEDSVQHWGLQTWTATLRTIPLRYMFFKDG